jgi:hypothetical protein
MCFETVCIYTLHVIGKSKSDLRDSSFPSRSDPYTLLFVLVLHLKTFVAPVRMKVSVLYSVSLFVSAALAFPANLLNGDISDETLAEINGLVAKIKREAETKRQLGLGVLKPGFDADAQRISTTGDHRYVSFRVALSGGNVGSCADNVARLHRVRMISVDHALV